jgi:uncharacterized protein YkwD
MKIMAILLLIMLSVGFTPHQKVSDHPETCLGAEEKKLYDLIMAYRKSKGLPSIPLSPKLTMVAQAHARDLADHFDSSDQKCNPHSWSNKGSWTACCYTNDHQQAPCMWRKPKEIADYSGNGYEIAYYSSAGANAQEGIDGWKLSPGHNAMIINLGTWQKAKWKALGIALYKEYGLVWFGEVEDASQAPVTICP